jgi:hypothetical protein
MNGARRALKYLPTNSGSWCSSGLLCRPPEGLRHTAMLHDARCQEVLERHKAIMSCLENREALTNVPQRSGGRHFMRETNWKKSVLDAVQDRSVRISVVLDDVAGASTHDRVMSAVRRWETGPGDPFDWEMAQLHYNGRLPTVHFFEGGAPVANPF